MRFPVGVEQLPFEKQNGRRVPLIWDEAQVVNAHAMFTGKSGGGKSRLLRRLIRQGAESSGGRVRFHVFDRHRDLATPGESVVRFSATSQYGCTNPLEVNPDPHFGGVRRAIDRFVSGIERSHKLGPRQVAALRRVLGELFTSRGYTRDPSTWVPEDPTEIAARMRGKENRVYIDAGFHQREAAKGMGAQWDGDLRSWWFPRDRYEGEALMWAPKVMFRVSPTVDDAVLFVRRKLEAMFLGANSAVMAHVTDVNRYAARYHRLAIDAAKVGRSFEGEDLLEKAAAARERAIEAFSAYLNAVETGRELDEVIDFKGADVMTSIADRISNLAESGVFGEPAPFDPSKPVWRYDISALSVPEAQMFVHFKMAERYEAALQWGEQEQVQEIVVLDESDIHFTSDVDNMPNKYAKETRKFGLILWAVSQSPSNFSEDFLANIGTKAVFRMDQTFYDKASRMLKVPRAELEVLRARYNALVMVENISDVRTGYRRVVFPDE